MCINLNDQQKNTLKTIRENSPRSDIPWSDILNLLEAISESLGGTVEERDNRVFVFFVYEQESRRGVLHHREGQRNASSSNIEGLQDLLLGIEVEL